jgi:hypothetical protein
VRVMLDGGHDQKIMSLVDEAKRSSVHRMLTETPFVTPVVASFPMSDLGIDETQARTYSANT